MAEINIKKKIERNTYGIDEKLEKEFDATHLKRSLIYVKKYMWQLLLALLLAIVATVVTLFGPKIVSVAIDEGMTKGGSHYGELTYIFTLGGLYLLCMVVSAVVTAVRTVMIARVGQNIVLDIRRDLFHHLQKLPFSYYDSRPQGKILVRVTNYVAEVSNLLSSGIVNAIIDVITLIVILVFMLSTSVTLTIPALCGVPVLLLLLLILKPAQRKAYQNHSNKRSNMTAYNCENIEGVKVTEMFNRQEKNNGIYKRLTRESSKAWKRSVYIWVAVNLSTENITVWAQMGVYAVAFFLLKPENVGVGVVVAMASYASRFWAPITNLTNIYNTLITTMAYLERIFETMDTPVDIDDKPNAAELPTIKGEVEFKDVVFGYDPDVKVLKNVSFKVEPGQSIALVGPTGAGKSTIVSLISRFYDVDSGSVTVDGFKVSDVTIKSLRQQMGIMLQDPFIFSGTIEDNIRYGKLDATDEEIVAAAKAVCAHDFISSMPNGYKTEVKERGSGLSQGQKQLISLARTLISNPRILVLDEATSSVDARTEQVLQQAVNLLLEGRTSFIVAHRLSTIQKCDTIMFIDDGQIIESGTHEQLLAKKGRYYELYTAQAMVEGSEINIDMPTADDKN